MKILHVITSLKVGGAEAALFNFLQKESEEQKINHTVICFYDGPLIEKIRSLGIAVYFVRGRFCRYGLGAMYAIHCIIKTIKPDIIQTALWSATIIGRLFAWYYTIPLVSQIHGDCRIVSSSWKNIIDALTVGLIKKQVIIAVSQEVKKAYVDAVITKALWFVDISFVVSQIEVILNGIDKIALETFAKNYPLKRSTFGIAENDFVIGAVGRLESVKAYDVLIKAFHKIYQPGMKLCLVGDGSQRTVLEQLVRDLTLEQAVIFVGMRTDTASFYSLFDCFALSSQSEGISIALLEAMVFGLPIISTYQGERHEVLVHEYNALLVPTASVDLYACAIKRLFQDQALRVTMMKNNRATISYFSLESSRSSYYQLYEKLTN